MKIGILTFHNAINYGAALQAYALQRKLVELGYDSEIIDYENDYFKRSYVPFFIPEMSLKKLLHACIAYRDNCARIRKFSEFRDRWLQLSRVKYMSGTIAQSSEFYDKFLVGSDQVWNLKLTHRDLTYLLDFCSDTDKKCSYAASVGNNAPDDWTLNTFRRYLSDFHRISTREAETARLLKSVLRQPVEIMIDPVFLLSGQDWVDFSSPPSIRGKYILTYKINARQDLFTCAALLSRRTGLPVVALQAPYRRIPQEFVKERRASPEEFVGWIEHAEYVLTDSFHGTAFSAIFGKKFLSFLQNDPAGGDCRIQNILSLLGLEDRIGSLENVGRIDRPVDYRSVREMIGQQEKKAERYLNDI